MPVYLWEGTTKKGEKKKGELEAADESNVRIQLRRQRIKAENIKKKPKDLFENIPFLQEKVKETDVVVFARLFATMINAGLPIIQCLELLGEEEKNKTFAKIIKAVKEDIIQVEPIPEPIVPAGRTLGSLGPGLEFNYQERAYIKYGTAKGIVAVQPTSDLEEVLRVPEDTIVEM